MIFRLLLCLVALFPLLLMQICADASPYLATVIRLPDVVSLTPSLSLPVPLGYAIVSYDLGGMSTGSCFFSQVPLYSEHDVYVAPTSQNGSFLVLANLSSGSEMFRYSAINPEQWKSIYMFKDSIPIDALAPPLMVGMDGTVWMWFESATEKSDVLKIFSPDLGHELGVYVLPPNHAYSAMALIGSKAVIFEGSSLVTQSLPQYDIRVVQENGHIENMNSVVGSWPPRYISAVDNLVTGMNPNGDLREFQVDDRGKISVTRTLKLPSQMQVQAYTALDEKTGICVLQTWKENNPDVSSYQIALFSLTDGTITQTAPLDFSGQGIFTWHDNIFVVDVSGTIHAYTRKLQAIGACPPLAGGLSNYAVSQP
ncbi:MAG TPA: hypothetical protein VMG59_11660 [Phycisphaerae bacterium]|nr:hypothetical protein [Phycisphaerae bacterium]